jgi:hypothetical protein
LMFGVFGNRLRLRSNLRSSICDLSSQNFDANKNRDNFVSLVTKLSSEEAY